MRTHLSLLVLAGSVALTGCELIVRFDPARLDGSGDGTTADRVIVDATDMTVPTDVQDVQQPTDVQDAGGDDVMDAGTDAADVTPPMDVVTTDVQPDVQPDVQTDVPVAMDVQPDVQTDAGQDSGTDDGVDASASDAGTDVQLIALNGCTYATAIDLTATAMPTINFPGATLMYSPACIRIHAGQTVTFDADSGSTFANHPLRPGDGATRTTQTGTPITNVDTGTTMTFTFPDPGTWGYYCNFHAPSMAGAIYVDP